MGANGPLRLIAAVTAVALWVAVIALHDALTPRLLGLVLVAVLARVTVTDLEERRIPNRVTVPASFAALVIGLLLHSAGVPAQVLAGLGTGIFLFAFAILSRGGLGMGDVKLGIVLGLFLGKYVIVALCAGLLASAVLSIGVLVRRGIAAGRRTAIPLGPFLALGGVVALLAGRTLVPGL
jgi:leader peptidase (prepilin peptidase)/N-methyltransferase